MNTIPLTAGRRRALELLADAGLNGATEESLLVNGITAEVLSDLVRVGWATSWRPFRASAEATTA